MVKKKYRDYFFVGILVIILLIIPLVVYNCFKKDSVKNDQKSEYILKYTAEEIVSNYDFDNKVTCIVVLKDNRYTSQLFDSKTGEDISFENIIKDGHKEDLEGTIKELLYLKYPPFIADVLVNNPNPVYSFYADRLVIYYYDNVIEPEVKEDLYLEINYEEIKDFLNFKVKEDATYEREKNFRIDESKKHIAITFDDGPSKYTEELVNLFNAYHEHTTFFFVGNKIMSNPNAIKAAYNGGHEIGYHSYDHTSFTRQKTATIQSEFEKSNALLNGIIGTDFHLVRPPYGSINATVKKALDVPFILWNVDTNDWRYRDTEYLVNYILDNVSDGDIILFHDSYETSLNAIKELLPLLYNENYQIVSVSELASIKGIDLENNTAYRYFR